MSNSDQEHPEDAAKDAAESAEDLERGGLPLQAQRRIAEETGAHPLFATGLNVGEFLLARAEGYDAVGQVMGSSIYKIGWQFQPGGTYGWSSGELDVVTRAHMEARSLALGRMEEEAKALGAHGVVGVRLTAREYEWGPGMLEFSAIGTAVRQPGAAVPKTPFLSDLSGEDFWTLVQAGYMPSGLAMGFSSYFVYGSSNQTYVSLSGGWGGLGGLGNAELTSFSHGVYQARSYAMRRLHEDAQRRGAHGVVGVKTEVKKRFVEGGDNQPMHLIVDFFVLGTAVVQSPDRRQLRTPSPALNMKGLKPMRPRLEGAELEE